MSVFTNFPSIFVGMVIATVFWWAVTLSRPLFQQMLEAQREKSRLRALEKSSDLENTYRKIIFQQTQGTHLSASLFALDEIALEPRLLAPPAYAEPGTPRPHLDIVEEALPYLPTDPEIAASYGGYTLTLPQALSGNSNLILTGQPGAGKTTALAWLAAQIISRQPNMEALHETIPFFIHVADLGLPLSDPKKPEDLLAPIVKKLAEAKGLDLSKLTGFIEYAFHNGRALFLLDGVDELPQPAIQEAAAYLRMILRQFPRTRIITTSIPEYTDGLLSLGFAPLTLMPWDEAQQRAFLQKWAALWDRTVASEAWFQAKNTVDSLLLNRWLMAENSFGLTPLEYTLKIWAAYAGDARGPLPTDAVEAHLRRLLPPGAPLEVLQVISTQASLMGVSLLESSRVQEWTKSFEPAAPAEPASPTSSGAAPIPTAPRATGNTAPQQTTANLLQRLIFSGILAAHGGSRVRFAHPVYQGYLTGKSLPASNAEKLLSQPVWAGQTSALRYLAAFSADMTSLVNQLLTIEDTVLLRPRLTAARMLRHAPRNAPWRNIAITALIQILQNEELAPALRAQAMAAFALSGDPNTGALFRQLMLAPSNQLRRLAAIGAGVVRDAKAVDTLISILANTTGAAQQAACLALVKIGTQPALEAVATVLMNGDEQLRISAAEALSNNPIEGYETLKDGITSEDILVRRAIVYGLARVDQSWAKERLEKVQTEDEQWVVRNAAIELLESRQRSNPHIPRRSLPPSSQTWLIEFAGKFGMGVTPGQPATDLYLLALKDERPEIRQAGLRSLRTTPTEGVLAALYPYLFGDDEEMKDEVFQVLSEIAMSGLRLPEPRQFGLG